MDKIPSKGTCKMAKNRLPKKEELVENELTSKNFQNIISGLSERKSKKLSGFKTIFIDCKTSRTSAKMGSMDFINNASSTSSAEAYGIMDLGSTLLLSSFKQGKRFAHDNVKFNFNLNSAVSITRNDDYEAKRLEAVNEFSNRLAGYSKLPAVKIDALINSNATLDYKAGLEAGFFDKNVKPVDKTSTPKSVEGNTGKTGILVGDKSTVPTSETEASKEAISATTKAEEIPGIDNIEVVEEKPGE